MYQFPQPAISSQPPVSQTSPAQAPISTASRRRLARHLVGLPLKDIERDLVLATLASTDGNRTTSARLLGLSVRTLRKRITEYAADGCAVTPRRGRPSRPGKQRQDARQSDGGNTHHDFLQQNSILGDAQLEQVTRDALRVRLHPVTSCDSAVSSGIPGSAERSSAFSAKFFRSFWLSRHGRRAIIRHRPLAHRLVSALALATAMFR